jgi:glycosyltransferase involved in cell wall biosynthesis
MREFGMRTAIVTETWPPEVNGVALTVQSLARGLRRLGHSVELVRPHRPNDVESIGASEFAELRVRSTALPRYPGLRVGLPAQSRLIRHWSSSRPQAIYVATEGPLGHSALGAARRLGIPACTGFHTRFDDFISHYGFPWLSPLVFAGMRRFHNRAATTLVPTRELADFLSSRSFVNVSVLSRAVDVDLFNPMRRDADLRERWGLPDGGLAVIHVGRLAAEKNLDLAVRAFREIEQRHAKARFIVVGDGPERARLAEANPDFIFAGMHRDEPLARHYASGDMFLFPSLTETFGNVTLEAMASGLPVVAFDYGAAREHIRADDCGVRVPFADTNAFVEASITLAGDPTRRARMATSAREAVSLLSPDAVSRGFADLMGSLCKENAA